MTRTIPTGGTGRRAADYRRIAASKALIQTGVLPCRAAPVTRAIAGSSMPTLSRPRQSTVASGSSARIGHLSRSCGPRSSPGLRHLPACWGTNMGPHRRVHVSEAAGDEQRRSTRRRQPKARQGVGPVAQAGPTTARPQRTVIYRPSSRQSGGAPWS